MRIIFITLSSGYDSGTFALILSTLNYQLNSYTIEESGLIVILSGIYKYM